MQPADSQIFDSDIFDSGIFNSDIEAARIAGLPVELNTRSLTQSANKISASKLASSKNRGARHQAALKCLTTLGTMLPVFDGLTARALAVQKYTDVIRRTGWYLVAVLFVALLGLLHFKYYVLPSYEAVREDMRVFYQITSFSFDMFSYITPTIAIIGGLLLLGLGIMLTGKFSFLLAIFGGRRFVRTSVLSAAAESVPLLRQGGMSAHDANKIAAELYSLDAVGRAKLDAVVTDDQQFVATCHTYSQYWSTVANDCFQRAQILVPVVGLTIVGGAVLLVYGLLVYGPLIGLLYDLLEANQLG